MYMMTETAHVRPISIPDTHSNVFHTLLEIRVCVFPGCSLRALSTKSPTQTCLQANAMQYLVKTVNITVKKEVGEMLFLTSPSAS